MEFVDYHSDSQKVDCLKPSEPMGNLHHGITFTEAFPLTETITKSSNRVRCKKKENHEKKKKNKSEKKENEKKRKIQINNNNNESSSSPSLIPIRDVQTTIINEESQNKDDLSLNKHCMKYEILREQYEKLQHDFSHLKYRYHYEKLRNKDCHQQRKKKKKKEEEKEEEEEEEEEKDWIQCLF